ncbi:MAG TPA: glycoside hydrolase domain-containing protein [Candidatus Acidoferrum sp.]|nr:glycoside hydrolase domain-containing protein [Candidatus Acidoferrum sp.]
MTSFGIDTEAAHVNFATTFAAWEQWSGGDPPAFACRNFLGGTYLWAHGEATNAFSSPSPGNLTALDILVPLIAPYQAADATRQTVTGGVGSLYGKLDANALCQRIRACIATGELTLPESQLVQVFLAVDPGAAFSIDYWCGWADAVMNFTYSIPDPTLPPLTLPPQFRPFRPSIRCAFTGANLDIDPNVAAVLQNAPTQRPDLYSTCWGFWADAPDGDPTFKQPNPTVDFSKIDVPTVAPVWIWRFSTKFEDSYGNDLTTPPHDWPYDLAADALNNVGDPPAQATAYMLVAQKWQCSVSNIGNHDLLTEQDTTTHVTALASATIPQITRPANANCGLTAAFIVPAGSIYAIGRYVRQTARSSVKLAEVTAINNGGLRFYTTFEPYTDLASNIDPTVADYYNSTHHRGLTDGATAFTYCAETLTQTPYSVVYFAVDWCQDPMTDQFEGWLKQYIADIQTAYATYLTTHPQRPFLIGVYGCGATVRVAYEQGIATGLWQSGSECTAESIPPRWPWPHATRWQYAGNIATVAGIGTPDPDVDWGDGGEWSLHDPSNVDVTAYEHSLTNIGLGLVNYFGDLLSPPQQ